MSRATIGRCATCQGLVDAEDLFCANCGTAVPDADAAGTRRLETRARNFACRGCGATMNYDAGAQSLKCPFCGSVDLAEDPARGMLAPELVLPFALGRDDAEGRLRGWLGSSFWHPGDLKAAAQVAGLTAAYVPFWIFAARVSTHWTADTSQAPPGARADWFPLAGCGDREYADVWVPASHGVDPAELLAIMPFDESAGVPPDGVDLEGVTVEQFSVSRRYARPLAQGRLEALEAEAVAAAVPGRSRHIHVNVLMEGATSRPALAPIYVLAYRYRDRVFRFVLNGQNGRHAGTAPFSRARLAAVVGGVILALVAILLAISFRR